MSSPPLRQLALQGAAAILVLSLAWPYFGVQGEALPWLETSLAIGGVALLFATLSRQPWWWRVIHAGFMPLVWFTQSLAIDPGVDDAPPPRLARQGGKEQRNAADGQAGFQQRQGFALHAEVGPGEGQDEDGGGALQRQLTKRGG
jgi:hypothetical protein